VRSPARVAAAARPWGSGSTANTSIAARGCAWPAPPPPAPLRHQLAARGVDQQPRSASSAASARIDQMVRLLGMRHVQRDDVGLAQQLIEWKSLSGSSRRARGRDRDRVPPLAYRTPADLGHVAADSPQPHDPIVLPRSSVPSNRLQVPLPAPHRLGLPGDVPHQASSTMACSAALTVFVTRRVITAIPRVAAGTSMLSTPSRRGRSP